MQKLRGRSRLGLPVFLLLLTTVYVAATFQIDAQFNEGVTGPRFLPFLAAVLMYVALGHIIWREWRLQTEWAPGALWPPLQIVLATAAYVAVFKPLGYGLSTFLYVTVLFHIFRFEAGRPVRRLLYALAVSAVFYGLFGLAFGIRLPAFPGGM